MTIQIFEHNEHGRHEIEYDHFIFPGGEVHVRLKQTTFTEGSIEIVAHLPIS